MSSVPPDPATTVPSPSTTRERTPGQRLYRFMKKVHMYAGLFVYLVITLYGVSGLIATFEHDPAARQPFPSLRETLPYRPPPGATDKEIADEIHALLDPPLANPVPEWALAREPDGTRLVNFYSVNGPTHVRVEEEEGVLEIERVRNSFPRFLINVHATTVRDAPLDLRLRLWTWLNEIGIWSLLLLAMSGVYLWLASRPRLRLALGSLLSGAAAFVLLWALIR